MWGLMRVKQRLSRRVLKGWVPVTCMVLWVIVMVITCHVMKQLDVTYRCDEVMWTVSCFA